MQEALDSICTLFWVLCQILKSVISLYQGNHSVLVISFY